MKWQTYFRFHSTILTNVLKNWGWKYATMERTSARYIIFLHPSRRRFFQCCCTQRRFMNPDLISGCMLDHKASGTLRAKRIRPFTQCWTFESGPKKANQDFLCSLQMCNSAISSDMSHGKRCPVQLDGSPTFKFDMNAKR